MTARARMVDESFGDYREALKAEARVDRVRLKGKWIHRSYIVVPNEGEMHKIKVPPYRKPKETKE